MLQEELIGIITSNGCVKLYDGRVLSLPHRGTDDYGYPQVIIDAELVGGDSSMYRQSVKPYIGMKCRFILNEGAKCGFNYTII